MTDLPPPMPPSAPRERICEGLMLTEGADGRPHFAPMGPFVREDWTGFTFRPFHTSTTFANLARARRGVFHVTDDCLLLAQAALGKLEKPPETVPLEGRPGFRLVDACRWYAVEIDSVDASSERTRMPATVVESGRIRDFWGWCRAKHAVLEAAVLATRLHMLLPEEVRAELLRLRSPLEKTGGAQEFEAFSMVERHVEDFYLAAGGEGGSSSQPG